MGERQIVSDLEARRDLEETDRHSVLNYFSANRKSISLARRWSDNHSMKSYKRWQIVFSSGRGSV